MTFKLTGSVEFKLSESIHTSGCSGYESAARGRPSRAKFFTLNKGS